MPSVAKRNTGKETGSTGFPLRVKAYEMQTTETFFRAAPPSGMIYGVTLFSFLLFAVLIVVVWVKSVPQPIPTLLPILFALIFGLPYLFGVTGYELRGMELIVYRRLGPKRFSLGTLQKAYADPHALRGSLRVLGNGGLFCFCGWFWNRKLGVYRAYVTNLRRCVVLVRTDRTLVISPEDPQRFLNALRKIQSF